LKNTANIWVNAQLKVLFVCSGNSYRSPVAEALLRKYAPEVQVDSAGTSPINYVSSQAREFLEKEDTIQFLKKYPEGIDSKRLQDYDLIVAMELKHKFSVLRRCPECAGKIEVWNIDDPYDTTMEYEEEIYRQIKTKVQQLAKQLENHVSN
jgi:protein-tyrosine-phosphatase